jgi:hypothetical protein
LPSLTRCLVTGSNGHFAPIQEIIRLSKSCNNFIHGLLFNSHVKLLTLRHGGGTVHDGIMSISRCFGGGYTLNAARIPVWLASWSNSLIQSKIAKLGTRECRRIFLKQAPWSRRQKSFDSYTIWCSRLYRHKPCGGDSQLEFGQPTRISHDLPSEIQALPRGVRWFGWLCCDYLIAL